MPRDVTVLTNPAAAGGRGERRAAAAVARLREAGCVVRELRGRDGAEALDLAGDAVAEGIPTLVVCGGDGMVHLAAQVMAGASTELGIIPTGTGNDVARYLGIPRRDPRAAADVVVTGQARSIDLARAGEKYFVTVLAAGFDALVNERANAMTWPHGQMRYTLATLAELRVFEPLHYELALDGEPVDLEAMLVSVGNGPSFGGGLRITEGAELDDGLLDVVWFTPMSRLELVRTYPRLYNASHVHHRCYRHRRARSVRVSSPGVVAYADGERLGSLPLTVDVAPSALRVICPR
ncbi:MAG TPA: diacylglycerol kinase [Nocardioidaceae bacterium]|nr:diacylglycerol kinase [Nocardioidaceae bacterium]